MRSDDTDGTLTATHSGLKAMIRHSARHRRPQGAAPHRTNEMYQIISACKRQDPVSDQILTILDFHFHYGVGSLLNERDLVAQIGNLIADRHIAYGSFV
jgi:hypothetical protein